MGRLFRFLVWFFCLFVCLVAVVVFWASFRFKVSFQAFPKRALLHACAGQHLSGKENNSWEANNSALSLFRWIPAPEWNLESKENYSAPTWRTPPCMSQTPATVWELYSFFISEWSFDALSSFSLSPFPPLFPNKPLLLHLFLLFSWFLLC